MTFIWAAIKEFFRPIKWPQVPDAAQLTSIWMKSADGKWYEFKRQ